MLRTAAVHFTHLCVSPRKELLEALRAMLMQSDTLQQHPRHVVQDADGATVERIWPQTDPPLAAALGHIVKQSLYMQTLSLMVDSGSGSAPLKDEGNLPGEVAVFRILDKCMLGALVTRARKARRESQGER